MCSRFYYASKLMHKCRLNPQNDAAKRGLERLEKQMKVCSFCLLLLIIFLSTNHSHCSHIGLYFFQLCYLIDKGNIREYSCEKVSEVKICDFVSFVGSGS